MINLKKQIIQNTVKGRHNVVELYFHSHRQHNTIHPIYLFPVELNIVAEINQYVDTFASICISKYATNNLEVYSRKFTMKWRKSDGNVCKNSENLAAPLYILYDNFFFRVLKKLY